MPFEIYLSLMEKGKGYFFKVILISLILKSALLILYYLCINQAQIQ